MDIGRLRDETPGCRDVIHLNSAGSALPPRAVLDAVIGHLELEGRTGGYEASDLAVGRLADSYQSLAALVGARPDEIAYVENATRAWDMAFYSIPFAKGDRILTTTSEYASNAIAYLQIAERTGAVIEVVPDDEHGQISLPALADSLDQGGVRLVAINHIPTHDGLINPVAEVGKLVRAAGALYLVDACQSVGHLDVAVREIGCDFLSATGRKFLRGPRGTGFLYVRREIVGDLEPPFADLHSADWTGPDSYRLRPDAKRFETWERYVAGQLGLGVAADYAMSVGMRAIEDRILALGATLRQALSEVPGVTVHDRGLRKSGLVTFSHESAEAADLADGLARQRIHTRLAAQTYRYDGGTAPRSRVRASVHYYNTEDELDRMVHALRALLGGKG